MDEALLCLHAREILDAALRSCSVQEAFQRKLRMKTEGGRTWLHFSEDHVEFTGVQHLRIVAAGKAAGEMLSGFLACLPPDLTLDVRGVLIGLDDSGSQNPDAFSGFQVFAGGHPLPNRASFDGAAAALALVREASTLAHCLCVFLISGGASAMMELPLDPAISLADTALFYRQLVHSGATISEINCIRKHFSAVKGGRLGQAAGQTRCITLLVSDVAPEQLDSLASGPTLPDSSTREECLFLLDEYRLSSSLPESVRRYFNVELAETPKAADLQAKAWVLLDSNDLGLAAAAHAKRLGYQVVTNNTCDDWDFADAAHYLLNRMRKLRPKHERCCVISTGEVTVSITDGLSGATHVGGRNQHFALYAATQLELTDAPCCVLSAGSDGIDGNSVAAGAMAGTETLSDPRDLQQAHTVLREFDSSTFFHARNATIVTGPTGNNLRDLRLLLTGPGAENDVRHS